MSNPPSTSLPNTAPWRVSLNRWWCSLFAHELAMVIAPGRIAMRCRHCGFESSGWGLAPVSAEPAGIVNDSRATSSSSGVRALGSLTSVARQH